MKAYLGLVLLALAASVIAQDAPPPTLRRIPVRYQQEPPSPPAPLSAPDPLHRRPIPPTPVVEELPPEQICDICLSQGCLGRMSIAKTIVDAITETKKTTWECDRGHQKTCTSKLNNDDYVCGEITPKRHDKNLLAGWKAHNKDIALAKDLPKLESPLVKTCPICESQGIHSNVKLLCGWSGGWNLTGAKVPRFDFYRVITYTCDRGHCIVADQRIVRKPDGVPFAAGIKVESHKNLTELQQVQAKNLAKQQDAARQRLQAAQQVEYAKRQAEASTELVEKVDNATSKTKEVGLSHTPKSIAPPVAPLAPAHPDSYQIESSPDDPMTGYDTNFSVPLKPLP